MQSTLHDLARVGIRVRLELRFGSGLELGLGKGCGWGTCRFWPEICKFCMGDFEMLQRNLQIAQIAKSRATFYHPPLWRGINAFVRMMSVSVCVTPSVLVRALTFESFDLNLILVYMLFYIFRICQDRRSRSSGQGRGSKKVK